MTEDDRLGIEISQEALGNPKSKRQEVQQKDLFDNLEGDILTFGAGTEEAIPCTAEGKVVEASKPLKGPKTRKKGSIMREMKGFVRHLSKKLCISPSPGECERLDREDMTSADDVKVEAIGGCTAIESTSRLNPLGQRNNGLERNEPSPVDAH